MDISAPGTEKYNHILGEEVPPRFPWQVGECIQGILSTKLGGGYELCEGTSQAAPMVAGVAGLLLSQDQSLTPAQVKSILELSADDAGDKLGPTQWDDKTGAGRLNAGRAMDMLKAGIRPEVDDAAEVLSCP